MSRNKAKLSFRAKYISQIGLVSMAVPVILFYLLFYYTPMTGLVIAFKNYVISDGIFQSAWVGLENFERLFSIVGEGCSKWCSKEVTRLKIYLIINLLQNPDIELD